MAQDIIPVSTGSVYSIRPPEETVGWKATKQFFFVIFKWKRLIVSFFLVFTIAASAAMYLKPPVRAATAKILLKGDRTPLMISGLANLSSRYAFSAQIMQTEIEMMRSREVLFPVAKKVLSGNGREEENLKDSEVDVLVDALSASTVATAIPETNIIQVTHFARTSADAETKLHLIIDRYLDRQAEIQSGSAKLLKFYEHEKERVGAQLLQAEEQL
ncbi:MAG: Wzz/FepE/Etk N-terminal domain-containing protein, partial [Candidatus Binatia bacterium]